MNRIYFAAVSLMISALLMTSCSNDDIVIESTIAPVQDALTISVDLSNFYSGYTFEDTKHNIDQIAQAYRTFNSVKGMYIQVRTLIYNKETDNLVDSIINYVTTTNAVTSVINLQPGDYYAFTTIAFATENKNSYWKVGDREKLSTAKLIPLMSSSKWSILSQSMEQFSVSKIERARVNTTPAPLGALVYFYFQNFQYMNESFYGTVSDNNVRGIALFTQRKALSYNLDPNASSKFNYDKETKIGSWYFDKVLEPNDFEDSWNHFMTNLYSYTYILEPEQRTIFGLWYEGETSFHGYGEATSHFTPGTTYLAYWDFFKLGEPYLGVADNNHWRDYVPKNLFEEPYKTWGASLSTVRSIMETKNYEVIDEGSNYLLYYGKNAENAVEYDFDSSGGLNSVFYYFDTSISLSTLSDFVSKKSGVVFVGNQDGTISYQTSDNKTDIYIYQYTYQDGTKDNIVQYRKKEVVSSTKALYRLPNKREKLNLHKDKELSMQAKQLKSTDAYSTHYVINKE